MSITTVLDSVIQFNHGRDPVGLTLKYSAMQRDSFRFFRATAHLFYQDWPQDSVLNTAPLAWVSGDLHLENFGSYKGDNRLSYFDINDFDEARLAPCTMDLARFLCSLQQASHTIGLTATQVADLSELYLDTYYWELRGGKARWLERSIATGMIRQLLRHVKKRSRRALLDKVLDKHAGHAKLNVDGEKLVSLDAEKKQHIADHIAVLAAQKCQPDFFKVLDIAKRNAGLSSLGLERYTILIQGKGSQRHYLLDMKCQPGSVLTPYVDLPQPIWSNEAQRVVMLQQRGQAVAPAFLATIQDGPRAYLLRELMPQEDRLDLEQWDGKFKRLKKVIEHMAELTAWLHIRTGGWQGAAIADQWQVFGEQQLHKQALLAYAETYSQKVHGDWLAFKAAVSSSRG